jgi:hypothetical protein
MMKLIDKIKNFLAKPETINAIQFLLVIIIAVFSAICTYKLTMETFNSESIAWMLTIIVEGSLTLFSFKFHAYSKKYVLIWIPYLIVSIIASQGALIGDADIKKSEKIHSSKEYKNYESEVQTANTQIASYQSRLTALNSKDYSKEIADINRRLADKRTELKNTISTEKTQRKRSDIQKEIDSLEKSKTQLLDAENKTMQEANSIRASMDNASSKKDNLKNSLADDLKLVGGVTGAFALSLTQLNVSEIQFWTMFFILLEITRFILLKDSKELYSSITGSPPSTKKPIPELEKSDKKHGKFSIKKGSLSTAPSMQKTNVVPFSKNSNAPVDAHSTDSNQTEIRRKSDGNQTEISNKILKDYIDIMYQTAKNNVCIWQKTIATKVGITSHQATKIIGYLKHLGIVEVSGNTKILVSKQEALQRIRRGA